MKFDGTGTDNINWFSKGKLASNTVWNDLASKSNNYFRFVISFVDEKVVIILT